MPGAASIPNGTLDAALWAKKCNDCQRIVIIGAGPTGLGAAYRFSEHNDSIANNTEVIVLEMERQAGGLASSYRDDKGFLWDNGGHVVFSHYDYFNRVLKKAVTDWNKRSRASYAYMMGSSGRRKFVPILCSIIFMFWTRKSSEEV